MPESTRVGEGKFVFEPDPGWPRAAKPGSWSEVPGVATDVAGRVYLFCRGPNPIMIFAADGAFQKSWGEGKFTRAHGITIGPDGSLWCADDFDHTVKQFTPEGRLLMTLGTSGRPSNTGATSIDYRTITHAGPPFYYPTNTAFAADGSFFISDGYGNARVHKFSPDGKLLFSWGESGGAPGQFRVPHGIAVARDGTVYVADRENSRIQFFSPNGQFIGEWKDLARPCQVAFDAEGNAYVAELGYRAGMWPGTEAPTPDATGGRVSILSPQGRLLARWGGGNNPTATGDFFAPHDICVAANGDVYVSEVVYSAGAKKGLVSADCHAVQRFVRVK